MRRIVHPPVDQHNRLRRPMTPGERRVFTFFDSHLPLEWEIYIEPHLNGLRPDLVLLNPKVGIAVFEIKDWNLEAMHRFVDADASGQPALFGERNGNRFRIKDNPILQVNRYKRAIFDLYCPRLDSRLGWAAITAGVIFPDEGGARVAALLAPFMGAPSPYQPVSGRDALAEGRLEAVFPTARYRTSKLMTEDAAVDLRGWLVEPDLLREQRRPLLEELDANQRQLATTKTQSGFRRIRGPAGSGKSLVLAARAARLADEGRSVLVVTYNITLRNYLHDLVKRGLTKPGASDGLVFTHFHGWCREVCERVGLERALAELYAKLPRPRNDMGPSERRAFEQQRAAIQFEIDDQALAALAMRAVADGAVEPYDAILVDEGQDFRPSWWNALRTALRDGGEMLLVADATQDIYAAARAWTDEAMTGAGFPGGRWAQLSVSYRLPPNALEAASDFAQRFLPQDAVDLPVAEQGSLALYPCHLRWVQCAPHEALSSCVEEIRRLMLQTGTAGLANADITILAESVAFGAQLAAKLEERGVAVLTTFASSIQERRRQKNAFWNGSEQVKATTLHSFKGWESRLLVVHVNQASDPQSLALVYVALTRLKRSNEGSWLTVICSAPELAEYGSSWARSS